MFVAFPVGSIIAHDGINAVVGRVLRLGGNKEGSLSGAAMRDEFPGVDYLPSPLQSQRTNPGSTGNLGEATVSRDSRKFSPRKPRGEPIQALGAELKRLEM